MRSVFFHHLVDVAVVARKSFVISDPVWGPILLVSTNVKHDSREWTGDIYIFLSFCINPFILPNHVPFPWIPSTTGPHKPDRILHRDKGPKFGIYVVSMLSIWIFIDFLQKLYLITPLSVSRVYHPSHFFSRFRIFLNRIIFSLFFFVFEISYIFYPKRCFGLFSLIHLVSKSGISANFFSFFRIYVNESLPKIQIRHRQRRYRSTIER